MQLTFGLCLKWLLSKTTPHEVVIRNSTWTRAVLQATFVLCFSSVQAQDNVRAIGAVIAPPQLIATYSCTTYAQAVFLPKVEARAKTLLRQTSDQQATLKRILSEYDSVLDRMCRETSAIFQKHRDKVLDAYARHLPGDKSDIAPFLANPNGSLWSSENAAFLETTAPLIQYYALVKALVPEILSGGGLDRQAAEDIARTSVGMGAQDERRWLVLLLADEEFAKVTPARFDIATLKKDEARLHAQALRLKYATPFYWFNDNASDLVRMHFLGFDVIREMGLADVYFKYEKLL